MSPRDNTKRIRIDGPPLSGKTTLLIDIANTLDIAGKRIRFVGENSKEMIHRLGLRKNIPYRTLTRDEREHVEVLDG